MTSEWQLIQIDRRISQSKRRLSSPVCIVDLWSVSVSAFVLENDWLVIACWLLVVGEVFVVCIGLSIVHCVIGFSVRHIWVACGIFKVLVW